MKLSTKRSSTTVIALALAAFAAGCGGSSGATPSSGSSTAAYGRTPADMSQASPASASAAKIAVDHSSLGPILVDGQGRTVYLFEKDTGPASSCYGACASIWPAVTTSGAPRGGTGLDAAKLGTAARSDRTLQVTYNGHPLYTYAGDSQPGQTNGEGVNGFGAKWYAVSPVGQAVKDGG